MKNLFFGYFGSKLYGTDSKSSDNDYKGLFLPDLKDCILGRAPKSISESTSNSSEKSGAGDIECQKFSLQHFIYLISKGEITCIDMIHTPKSKTLLTSPEWEFIRENRSKFYTKTMRGYLGYCYSQTQKYNNRGKRLNNCNEVIGYLKSCEQEKLMGDYWEELPELDHVKFIQDERGSDHYSVCGRMLAPTIKISYALSQVELFASQYGVRAKSSAENDGVDWKAVSHAYRAIIQLDEILETGDLIFPLVRASEIKKIKFGDVPYEYATDKLSDELDRVTNKLDNSAFPRQIDMKFWEKYIISAYG